MQTLSGTRLAVNKTGMTVKRINNAILFEMEIYCGFAITLAMSGMTVFIYGSLAKIIIFKGIMLTIRLHTKLSSKLSERY